jgi:hypothetical protein
MFGEVLRVDRDMPCSVCGKAALKHPMDKEILDSDGYPYLNVFCTGERIKL